MSDEQSPDGLLIRRTNDGTTLVLALDGELDLGSAASLETELSDPLSDGYQHIVIDLTQLSFMDSRGLVTLLTAQNAAQANQKAFTLRRAGQQVQRLFAITGLKNLFTFED